MRGIGRSQRLWRAVRLARVACATRTPVRFVVGEWRGGSRRYLLRAGVWIVVRHRTRDLDLIAEIFGHLQAYRPPQQIAEQLAGPINVLDLGGNIGMFGAYALSRWDVSQIRSFEPDPENARVLAATIAANHAAGHWQFEQAAVSNRRGMMPFTPGLLAESRQAVHGEPSVLVRQVDVFELAAGSDVVKIDIEGGEWAILGDARFARLPARLVVMEWHWRLAPEPDAHRAARDLLGAAGYQIVLDQPHGPDRQTGMIWARRPESWRP